MRVKKNKKIKKLKGKGFAVLHNCRTTCPEPVRVKHTLSAQNTWLSHRQINTLSEVLMPKVSILNHLLWKVTHEIKSWILRKLCQSGTQYKKCKEKKPEFKICSLRCINETLNNNRTAQQWHKLNYVVILSNYIT